MTTSDRIFEQLLKTGRAEVRLSLTDYENVKELLRTAETIYLDKHITSAYSPASTLVSFSLRCNKD